MPPRKKARHSQATSPSPSASRQKTPETAPSQHSNSSPNKPSEATASDDPWSDHEEIGLFKGLMIWKPTGIHKHFRLLALHNWLLENNYIHPRNEHTKPKGIRAKLETLYNMDALDAREDARQLPAVELPDVDQTDAKGTVLDDDIYSEVDNRIEQDDFALPPEEGFEKDMWDRRMPSKKQKTEEDESDLELPDLNLAEEPPVRFVATVSIEPSDNATPGSRRGRAGGAGSRRKSLPKVAAAATRRSARQAESTADEEEGTAEEEKNEDEEEEEEEIENSDSEDRSEASTPAPRATRTKGARGRTRGRAGGQAAAKRKAR
ncbi:hypothetical protein CKM354_000022500 [Cercospora kikuchii]|uniref:Chromatin modification-related protein EAF7 n=1 Tax=Cercospora kikuchii TaxID=84275 RepID=A0A9P3C5L3_9PEZI|nr:uncharacterized protein CKM354_000022500 [Cercospora kikuchii]GIZ36758.1 hypothetical protein CKM354_000022500 [Cercospora kikuchii]